MVPENKLQHEKLLLCLRKLTDIAWHFILLLFKVCDFRTELRIGTLEIFTLGPHFPFIFLLCDFQLSAAATYTHTVHQYLEVCSLGKLKWETLWILGPSGVLEAVHNDFQETAVHISSQPCSHIRVPWVA